jgi:hypothetical protein
MSCCNTQRAAFASSKHVAVVKLSFERILRKVCNTIIIMNIDLALSYYM